MKHKRRFIEGLDLIDGNKKVHIVRIRRVNNKKKKYRNDRVSTNKMRQKFGIVMPNSMKEVLLAEKVNGDTKWNDAINKEMMALEKLNAWKFHPPWYHIASNYQRAPLRMILDVKKEDKRQKARHVVGGQVINSSHLEFHCSVLQSTSARMLLTIVESCDLKVVGGGAGNAFPHALSLEKVCAADLDVWTKKDDGREGYSCASAHADDFPIIGTNLELTMKKFEEKLLMRTQDIDPLSCLGLQR